MTNRTIAVDADALRDVLSALVGPAHHIRELQATRSLHALGHPNPIEKLLEQFNDGGVQGIPSQASPAPDAVPIEAPLTLDFKQAAELLEMFGGEPGLVTLQLGNERSHSGPGLYAYYTELPEEGAGFLGAEPDDEATPQPLAAAPASGVQVQEGSFQQRVQPWLMECFGPMVAGDREERNHRFLEEALELVQALGCSASEAHQLVDYVYGRALGDPAQEVGGVMVTLAALCIANGLDMHSDGETELARINEPEMTKKIRAKQAAKPKHSPLPAAPSTAAIDADYVLAMEVKHHG